MLTFNDSGMNVSALSSQDFRRYLLGNIFGLNANWILRLLLGWIAWDLTQSPAFVGIISFLNFSPVLIGGPIFGVIVDRSDVRRAALLVQALIGTLSITLLMLLALDALTPVLLAIYAGALGTVLAAYQPVRLSLGPRLVEKAQVSSVVSLGAMNFNLSRLTGPAIGGILIASVGETLTVAFVCLLQVPFIFMLSRLHPREQIRTTEIQPFFQSFRAGIRFIALNRSIWISFVVVGLFSVIIRGVLEILPILADGVYQRGPAGLGAMAASVGGGALLASVLQVILPIAKEGTVPLRGLMSAFAGAVMFTLAGVFQNWTLALFLIAGIGFCSAMVGINFQTSVQMQLDDDIRGRVMSLWMTLAVGGTSVGALVMGAMAGWIGLPMTLSIIGSVAVVIFTLLLPRLRS